MRATIEVFGDKQFDRELRAVGRRATAARPMFDALGWDLIKYQREQFATGGAHSGGWAPLEPETIASKGHDTILVDTGAGRDSFMYGDSQNIFQATDDFLRFGSESESLSWHQPDRKGRRAFDLSESFKDELVRSMQHWVMKGEIRI